MQQQAQAQAQGPQPDGGGGGGESQEGQPEDSQQEQQGSQQAQQQAAQAQAMAIDQFIQANPELFKSMTANLKKAEFHDAHVDEMRDALIEDFDRASEKLMKDIMEAIKSDVDSRDEADE